MQAWNRKNSAAGGDGLREFIYDGIMPELKIGDKVEVYVEKIESRNGKTILSREKAIREKYWIILEKALQNSETVNGIIFGIYL